MLSPASNGSVQHFTSASRALLAWIVHIPGSPALRASSRSRHSSARTSPTIIRDGRMRRLSFTRSRSRTSPVPSSPCSRVCRATQSGWVNLSTKTAALQTCRSRREEPAVTTATTQRPTEAICPPWCSGHGGTYQGWENADPGQLREHSGFEINIGAAHAYLNQTENEDHSLRPSQVDLYVDHDTAGLTPAQAREFARALLDAADWAEERG